jgi:hypothetical protein
MRCQDYERLLLDYDGLDGAVKAATDAHSAACAACEAYRSSLAEVDREMARLFAGIPLSSGFSTAVLTRIRTEPAMHRPSPVPEVLDFIGWAAMLALGAALFQHFRPLL